MQDTPEQQAVRDEEHSPRGDDKDTAALYGVDKSVIREVQDALEQEDADTAHSITTNLHAADQAYLIDMLPSDDREALLDVLGDTLDPQILVHLEDDVTEEVLEYIGADAAAAALSNLETDEAVSVLEEIELGDQQEILDATSDEVREQLQEGLAYPEGSAGRLMRKKVVLVPEFWTVGNTIDYLRTHEQLPDEFYSLFVVDARNRPKGYVLLSLLIRCQREQKISELMHEEIRKIPVDMDQEEAAHIFRKYGLVSAPVVGPEGRVHGMITIDDIVDVIQEEADEDVMRLGGIGERDLFSALTETVRRRFPWLFVNLLTAIVASMVIGVFEGTINQMVALAVLMPIIASMGGNAGTQTVTVAVRAIATKELTDVNALRVIGKETAVGFVNGLLFAALSSAMVLFWYQDPVLASVFAIATVTTMTIAGFSGAIIPLALTRFGADPAVASSVFLTTVTDVVGFFAFLGVAAWMLM